MKFTKGRQGSGYEKLKLYSFWRMDCYILRFNEGTHIPTHKDPIDQGRHYRLNIILKKPKKGGIFSSENTIFKFSRIVLFRPDLYEHSVSKIEEGTRYVLSLGFKL